MKMIRRGEYFDCWGELGPAVDTLLSYSIKNLLQWNFAVWIVQIKSKQRLKHKRCCLIKIEERTFCISCLFSENLSIFFSSLIFLFGHGFKCCMTDKVLFSSKTVQDQVSIYDKIKSDLAFCKYRDLISPTLCLTEINIIKPKDGKILQGSMNPSFSLCLQKTLKVT